MQIAFIHHHEKIIFRRRCKPDKDTLDLKNDWQS